MVLPATGARSRAEDQWEEASAESRRSIIDDDKTSSEGNMLWMIFTILFVMWLLGMVTSYTFGGFLHILLVLAIASVLIRVIQGRQPF